MHQLESEELEALKAANTFDELADIALVFLARVRAAHQEVVQICGPMSTGGCGSFEGNMERFNRAVAVAVEKGVVVFNQVLFQEAMIRICAWKDGDPYPEGLLTIFYQRVLSSGHITKGLFLSDWESSRGARWEYDFLVSNNIPVEGYPLEWLS